MESNNNNSETTVVDSQKDQNTKAFALDGMIYTSFNWLGMLSWRDLLILFSFERDKNISKSTRFKTWWLSKIQVKYLKIPFCKMLAYPIPNL